MKVHVGLLVKKDVLGVVWGLVEVLVRVHAVLLVKKFVEVLVEGLDGVLK